MYLLFDIGGTNTRIAVSKDGESLQDFQIVPTPPLFEEGIRIFKQVGHNLANGQKYLKIAGGIAGPLDKTKSFLVTSPHINGWIEKPLKTSLEEIFNAPAVIQNDTALVGLGEASQGAGKEKKVVAYLGIGTGVGGVRIINQQIDTNSLGFEPGHQIIIPNGNCCNCGGKGHLETYISGYYLENKYQQKCQDIKDEVIWDEVAKYLSIGINNTIVHWSPEIVVLGGSVMKSIPLNKVISYLKEELVIFPQLPEITLAALGDNAGLYGALELVKC